MSGFDRPSVPLGQFGMPLFGVSNTLPFTGNYFFVNETTGSDGNQGGPQDPLKTLTQALSYAQSNNNDVIFLTGTAHVSATLAWSKSRVHLIGLDPDAVSNARARISQTGSAVFSPLVSVTGSECIFKNIGAFHGFDDASAQICWSDTGGRNSYEGCSFLGMANATAAAQAGGRSLVVGGTTGESYFNRCQIGLDTITRSAANASLELTGGVPRVTFRDCVFPIITSSAAALFVMTAGAAAIDRWIWFKDCIFINNKASGGSTTMTVGVSMVAAAGGLLAFQNSSMIGVTDLGDAGAFAQMWIDMPTPSNSAGGLMVNAA